MLYSLIFAMLSMFCFVTPAWPKPDHQFSSEEIAVIKEAAGKGGIKAQALLGTLYYYGNGVPEDEVKAVKWWRKSAEQGSPFAQYDLAMAYHDGIGGLTKSNKKAVEWFTKGAKAGDVRSQYNLGIAYYHALGVKKNKAEAMKWFQKASDQDNADAQYILAAGYKDGIGGLPKDIVLAYVWISRSKTNGNIEAKRDIDALEQTLSPEQKAQAKRILEVDDKK